jgi:hypothetical protein
VKAAAACVRSAVPPAARTSVADLPEPHAFGDKPGEPARVEVDVREGREEGVKGKGVHFGIDDAHLSALHREEGDAFYHMDEQILKGRDVGLFSAHARNRARLAFRSLFTLVTKHVLLLFSWLFPVRLI